MSLNTSIFDRPIVSREILAARSWPAAPDPSPQWSSAAVKAAVTRPSSATVVPAMARQATVILGVGPDFTVGVTVGVRRDHRCRPTDAGPALAATLVRPSRPARPTDQTASPDSPRLAIRPATGQLRW